MLPELAGVRGIMKTIEGLKGLKRYSVEVDGKTQEVILASVVENEVIELNNELTTHLTNAQQQSTRLKGEVDTLKSQSVDVSRLTQEKEAAAKALADAKTAHETELGTLKATAEKAMRERTVYRTLGSRISATLLEDLMGSEFITSADLSSPEKVEEFSRAATERYKSLIGIPASATIPPTESDSQRPVASLESAINAHYANASKQ